MIYDSISDATESKGIDLQLFYDKPSYFGKNESGVIIPWRGSHQTLIHWPLADYLGGPALLEALASWTREVDAIAGTGSIQWIRPEYWHSTVFSPVHSSNPEVIAQSQTDIAETVGVEVPRTKPYLLRFSRIIITVDGGLLAVAYVSNDQLDALRARLLRLIPVDHVSPIVHITLGHFTREMARTSVVRLCQFARQFRNDSIVIGEIAVPYLTLGIYHAPFLDMKVEEILRLGFLS